jgi:prepilin-type N-terminal cleavage/methylation domain-containing protein
MIPQNKRGFTLMEVLITITLLTVVLALCAGTLYQVYTYYADSEELWIVKQEVTAVSDWMINSLQLAAEADILSENYTSTRAFDISDKHTYIYQASDDGNIYYRSSGKKSGTKLTHMAVDCSFNIPATTKRALEFNVSGETPSGRIYNVDSAVTLLNLAKISEIKGNTGHTVKLTGNDLALSNMTASVSGGCFIATAAYGSPEAPAVMLLRDFRDEILLKTKPGEEFVTWYYRVSPPLAKIITDNSFLKFVTQILLVPLIIIAVIMMFPLMYIAVGLTALLIVYFSLKKRRKCSNLPQLQNTAHL